MTICCEKCGKEFQSTSAPCPDNIEWCCVAHLDKNSFLCKFCGHDNGPSVVKCFKEGRVEIEEGISIINTAALQKLEIS